MWSHCIPDYIWDFCRILDYMWFFQCVLSVFIPVLSCEGQQADVATCTTALRQSLTELLAWLWGNRLVLPPAGGWHDCRLGRAALWLLCFRKQEQIVSGCVFTRQAMQKQPDGWVIIVQNEESAAWTSAWRATWITPYLSGSPALHRGRAGLWSGPRQDADRCKTTPSF